MKKTISKVLMCFGAVLVLGAAGDSDVQRIPFGAVIVKLIIGMVLFAVGYILYKKVNTPEPKSESAHKTTKFVNSKQATTPAYGNNFTTTERICQQ